MAAVVVAAVALSAAAAGVALLATERCILTVSSLYPHCILIVSSLYPYCIPVVVVVVNKNIKGNFVFVFSLLKQRSGPIGTNTSLFSQHSGPNPFLP